MSRSALIDRCVECGELCQFWTCRGCYEPVCKQHLVSHGARCEKLMNDSAPAASNKDPTEGDTP